MLLRVFYVFLLLPLTDSADERRDEFYRRAVPAAERFVQQFEQGEPLRDFTVYTLFDNIALLLSANTDLPKDQHPSLELASKLLRFAEEMQDKNPENPTFGNFRWYWSSTETTDRNAVEFALARMLSILLDTPAALTEETQTILTRLLERSAHACLNRRVPPDYTNIALCNAVHLILLGQVLDRPKITQEGERRLQNIVLTIWEHGIFEYNSPAYYFIDIDALQLGFRHVSDPRTKRMIHALLELFWTDLSLHWFKPGLRQAGAQSRTYNYLTGTSVPMTRILSFAGLAPYDDRARYNGVLNSFRALYQPPPAILEINGQYPRWIARNWGSDPGQWATLFMFEDIALGTAGAIYNSRQNMVQTVNLAGTRGNPQSYFLADGREDPYGMESFPVGSGGQRKALHIDFRWIGAQRTVDSLGIALYPPEALVDPLVTSLQTHFVVRKPESIWVADKQIQLLPHQPVSVGNMPVVFRYKTCVFGIRAVWSRHQSGQPAEAFLIDDSNELGVYRLTVEHGVKKGLGDRILGSAAADSAAACCLPSALFPGTAFWLRIGSRIESDEQFSSWRENFVSAKVNRLDVKYNDVDIAVVGQDGVVAAKYVDAIVATEPDAPTGILTLDGKDLGRPILEKIPEVARFAQWQREARSIRVNSLGTYWEAESGYSYFEDWIVPVESASGGFAARINHDVSWQLRLAQSGEYFLWGRVLTLDSQHDSFFAETAGQLPDDSFMRRSMLIDWHLGTRVDWTWVRLPTAIRFERGTWRLTLKPRENEGKIDQLFLTTDPAKRPKTEP